MALPFTSILTVLLQINAPFTLFSLLLLFTISSLPRLGVKQRLSRTSWSVLASTHPLMFPPTSPREALFAYLLSSLESAFVPCEVHPFLFMLLLRSTSFSPRCSSHSLWLSPTSRFGDVDWWLCSFSLLAKAALASSPTAHFVALMLLFLFGKPNMLKFFHYSPRHYASSPLVSAAPTRLPLLFSSPSLRLSFCPLLCLSFYLKLSGRNCPLFPPVLSDYNGSPDSCFSQGTTHLMCWPGRALLLSSVIPCSLSLLISRIHSFLRLAVYCLI